MYHQNLSNWLRLSIYQQMVIETNMYTSRFHFTVKLQKSRDMRFPTMWYVRQQSLRSACAYAQSDQNLCL